MLEIEFSTTSRTTCVMYYCDPGCLIITLRPGRQNTQKNNKCVLTTTKCLLQKNARESLVNFKMRSHFISCFNFSTTMLLQMLYKIFVNNKPILQYFAYFSIDTLSEIISRGSTHLINMHKSIENYAHLRGEFQGSGSRIRLKLRMMAQSTSSN